MCAFNVTKSDVLRRYGLAIVDTGSEHNKWLTLLNYNLPLMICEPSLKANAAHSSPKYTPMRVIFLFYDHSLFYFLPVRRSTSVADVPTRNLSRLSLLCALLTTAHAIF